MNQKAGILMPGLKISIVMIGMSLLTLIFTCAISAQGLSLRQAVDIALTHNDKVHQYEDRLAGRKWDERVSIGNFLPSVTLNGGYNVMNDPLTMNLDPIRDVIISTEARNQVSFAGITSQNLSLLDSKSQAFAAAYQRASKSLDGQIPHFLDTLKDKRYPTAQVAAVLPIYAGGRLIAGARVGRADREIASFELTKTRNEVIQETVVNYLAVVLMKNIVNVRREILAAMQQHRKTAEKLSDQGVVAKYNLLRAQVAESEAERNLFNDENNEHVALLALYKTLNTEENASVEISDSLVYYPVSDSLNDLLEKMKTTQPIFSILERKEYMAHQKVVAQRGALLPQVGVFGRVELFQDYLSALEPPWIVGVYASIPLFSGGKNVGNLNSARAQEKEVKSIKSSINGDMKLWINKSYCDMRNAEQRYIKLKDDLELAMENLRQCKSRFQNGYGTSLEVIDAQLVVERNRIDQLNSLYEYFKSMIELHTGVGNPESIVLLTTK